MKKILTLLLIACFVKQTNAQFVTTVAGNHGGNGGTSYASGDGGQATNASLNYPFSGTFDAQGNMYIVDIASSVIRKVNTAGIISTFAGNYSAGYSGDGGLATAAQLNEPVCIATFGPKTYISDDQNNVIRMVDKFGYIYTAVGTGVAGFSGDGGPATAAQLNSQNGITFDATGNLYITDGSNNRVRMVNTAGIITTIAGTGVVGFSGDGGQATAATLNNPVGITTDTADNIYVVDAGNHVRKINTAGIITTVAGNGTSGFSGDGGQATNANINFPNGIAVDAVGNLYISDQQNNRIRKVNTAGIIYTIAGTTYAGYNGDGWQGNITSLFLPEGIFFDTAGNLYVADDGNGRIRKITNVIPDTNQIGVKSISSPVLGCSSTTISPIVTIENYGTNTLTSCNINYKVDNGTFQTYSWTGLLTTGQTATVNLPSVNVTAAGGHDLFCICSLPNNTVSSFQSGWSDATFFIAYGASLPLLESFETTTSLPDTSWSTSYSYTGGSSFQPTTQASATGSVSCMLDNINNVAGNTSVLQTVSSYDLSSLASPLLTFKAAYQQKTTANADKLQIFTSTNCGATWSPRKTITATVLAALAGGTSTSPYTPTSNQFTTYTVPISAVANNNNVMFRWAFVTDATNGPGNNLYIDDINIIDNLAGIQNIENNTDVTIYPNPAQNNFTVEVSFNEKQTLSVFDVNGKQVLSQTITGTTNIDAGNLSAGVYNINMSSNEAVINKKLVIVR